MVHANERDSGVIDVAAGIVAHVGDADFPAQVIASIQSIVSFDSALFLGCVTSHAPQLLYDGRDERERDAFYGAYLNGAYLLVPGCRAAQDADISGVRRLSEVFPGYIDGSQYFSVYWGQTGMIDELFIFVRIDAERIRCVPVNAAGPFQQVQCPGTGNFPGNRTDTQRTGLPEARGDIAG